MKQSYIDRLLWKLTLWYAKRLARQPWLSLTEAQKAAYIEAARTW